MKKLPDNALKNNQLHHEALSEVSIHGFEQRDAHDQSVGQSGEREESDEPIQPSLKQDSPHREHNKHQQLRESVSNYKLGVHLIWVVLRYEVEGQDRNGKHRDEPVNAGALIRREDLAPLHRPICNQHCKIQRNHSTHDLVEIICTDHLLSIPLPLPLPLPAAWFLSWGAMEMGCGTCLYNSSIDKIAPQGVTHFLHMYSNLI